MVGRGLRTHANKTDCLVLDFSHCIKEHGPIDATDDREVRMKKCEVCNDVFSYIIGCCPNCGWEIPPLEKKQVNEQIERTRRLHEVKAAEHDILSTPKWLKVDAVRCHLRQQPGKPDALRLQFRSGQRSASTLMHLNSTGKERSTANHFWNKLQIGSMPTVEDALQDMFLADRIAERVKRLLVLDSGTRLVIRDYEITLLTNNKQTSHYEHTTNR